MNDKAESREHRNVDDVSAPSGGLRLQAGAPESLAASSDPVTRVAEIRQENRGGDVSSRDIGWLCDEIGRVREQRDNLLVRLEADPERAGIAALDGLRKLWTEDDAQYHLILDWVGVAGGLGLSERVRILALELATRQGYDLAEAERLAPPAFKEADGV